MNHRTFPVAGAQSFIEERLMFPSNTIDAYLCNDTSRTTVENEITETSGAPSTGMRERSDSKVMPPEIELGSGDGGWDGDHSNGGAKEGADESGKAWFCSSGDEENDWMEEHNEPESTPKSVKVSLCQGLGQGRQSNLLFAPKS